MYLVQNSRAPTDDRWGLVLAAGDGTRLQDYIRHTLGRELPKQYVNFIGRRSMIEHTFARAEKLIDAQNLVTVISRRHLEHREVRRQLASRPRGTVIAQPTNRETGPGILLPLVHIYKRCPEAIVSVFPSDHFILEEERFMTHVDLAAEAVARNPMRIVLLAMEAHSPEEEYGYVIPTSQGGEIDLHGTRPVSRFVEKPNRHAAQSLVDDGALWSTMVMVFKASTLLQMIERLDPDTYRKFNRILDAAGTSREQEITDAVYRSLQPINFSKGILERLARADRDAVAVLPVLQVYWSDWGSPTRLFVTQRLLGVEPERDWIIHTGQAR